MWTTRDGYTLSLPRFRIRRTARRVAQFTERAHATSRGAPPVGLLVRYARRSGFLKGSTAARPYPVFTSSLRGKTYRLYTKPRGHTMFDIVLVRVIRALARRP